MGRYINWADVTGRYGEIGRNRDATDMSSNYIAYAEAFVDGALGTRFTTPFSSNNVTARDLAIDYAYLMAYKYSDPDKAQAVMADIEGRIKRLKDGDEVMVIDGGAVVTIDSMGAIWSNTENYHPVFGMSDIADATIDIDMVDAEDDARD